MKIVHRDYVLKLKSDRRAKLPIEYHANGDCIHMGKISHGCRMCYKRGGATDVVIYSGSECNLKCPVCYYPHDRVDNKEVLLKDIAADQNAFANALKDHRFQPDLISYSCEGETLLYPEVIKVYADLIKEKRPNLKVYSFLYTNGVLADKDMLDFLKECNITELRFHLSASYFSNQVIDNLILAREKDFIVTLEEPSLPENKEKLLEILPFLDKIGVAHIDMIEPRVTRFNYKYLHEKYPDGLLYQDHQWAMYDDGLVYDIMESKYKNNYKFSIIDCSSRVELKRLNITEDNPLDIESIIKSNDDIINAINNKW